MVELRQVRQIESIYQCTVCSYLCANLQLPLLHYVIYTSMSNSTGNISAPCAENVYMDLNILTNWKAIQVQSTARLHDTLGHTHCSNTSILYIANHANIAHAAHNFTVGSPDSNISLALS